MADGIPSLLGLPWGFPSGWTSPTVQHRSKLEPQTTLDGYCWYRGAEELLLTELRRIPMNAGEVWKTHWAKIESWVKRPQQTRILSVASGIHLPVDPKKLRELKYLMCCGQLAPGRFSEGKLLQRTRQKVAPQTPERKLRVGEISERCWPGARPQGRHLMAMLCPQGLVRSSPKQQQGSVGFVPWVGEVEAAAPMSLYTTST